METSYKRPSVGRRTVVFFYTILFSLWFGIVIAITGTLYLWTIQFWRFLISDLDCQLIADLFEQIGCMYDFCFRPTKWALDRWRRDHPYEPNR